MDETNEAGVEADESRAPETEGVEAEAAVRSAEAEDSTDWKAIAESERTRAENYKNALTQKRQLRNVTPSPELEVDDEDDKPLTRKDIRAILREEVIPVVSGSKEDTLLSQKVSDPAKRDYIKQLLSTRIVRTGTSDTDIGNDIDDAIAMADRKKTEKVVSELRRAANNRPQAPSAGSSAERDTTPKEYKWNAAQSAELEKKARSLNVDPEKFKKDAWDNQKRTKVLM